MNGLFSKWLALFRPAAHASFHPSQHCTECGSRLMRATDSPSPETWLCPNLDCPARIIERLMHWCAPEAMNIAGCGVARIESLVRGGLVRDVAELYRLKPSEIAGISGIDPLTAKQLFDAISDSRHREAWRVLFGLSIPNLDASSARAFCQRFGSVDNVFAAGAERLAQTEGVGPAAAAGIAAWYSDPVHRRLVRRLFKAGLNFKA